MSWLDDIITGTLKAEGWPEYTDRPNDRGGPTKGGITLRTLSAFRQRVCTVDELRALTEIDARSIYAKVFVQDPRFDRILDSLLRWQVVDAGIMSGPERVTRWLQTAAGVKADGVFGLVTDTRINSLSPHALALRFAAARIRFYGRLITDDPRQSENAAGWMNRATKFIEYEEQRSRGIAVA